MATLDEVAEQFALDEMFSYYPDGASIADLAEVANSVSVFTEVDTWLLCEACEELGYVSADAIVSEAEERADSFRRYYAMVDDN